MIQVANVMRAVWLGVKTIIQGKEGSQIHHISHFLFPFWNYTVHAAVYLVSHVIHPLYYGTLTLNTQQSSAIHYLLDTIPDINRHPSAFPEWAILSVGSSIVQSAPKNDAGKG